MLSFCILTCEHDRHHIPELLKTLPDWAEKVIAVTKKWDKPVSMLVDVQSDITKNAIFATYGYSGNFDFSHARNAAHTLVTQPWIFAIDPDERLMIHQHDYLKAIISQNNYKIGGFISRNYSIISADKEKETGLSRYESLNQVRLYRKHPEFFWRYALHENIEDSIRDAGFEIHESNVLIHHLGYEITKPELSSKIDRNIDTVLNNPQLLRLERYRTILNELYTLKNNLENSKWQ